MAEAQKTDQAKNSADNGKYKVIAIHWIDVNDKLPEDFQELTINPTDGFSAKTKRVLVLTDAGSITDNRRLKMQIGQKEWKWFMGYDEEEVIKWAVFEDPTE